MINNKIIASIKIAHKLDVIGQYKLADKYTKKASILMMAITLKEDLEDGVRALFNYFDERQLTKLLKETNILEKNGDISARPIDYSDLFQKLSQIEPISPPDMPTNAGKNSFSSLNEVRQKILNSVETIDKLQISISHAHDVQREQLKTINQSQSDTIPDE
jgi:hypothetical protein